MTRLTPLLPALLFLALLLAAVSAQAFDPRTDEEEFEVFGGNDWVTTGFSVTPEDRVTIRADGEVCFGHSRYYDSCVGPEGMDRAEFQRRFHGDAEVCDDPYIHSNHAALIGKLEGGYPYSFGIGGGETFTGKRGTLMLRVNDCTLANNSGYFIVTVKVEYDVSD